jgi:hypothetical protein
LGGPNLRGQHSCPPGVSDQNSPSERSKVLMDGAPLEFYQAFGTPVNNRH